MYLNNVPGFHSNKRILVAWLTWVTILIYSTDLHYMLFQIKSLFRIFVFYELILQLFKHGTLLIDILLIF